MPLSIALILALFALVFAILSATRPWPILWVSVVLLSILELLRAGMGMGVGK